MSRPPTEDGATATVSVVIPTRDRPAMLSEALASVYVQTVRPHEVIVVNNGRQSVSTEEYPGARVLDIMRDAGAAQARNFGAVHATGTHIAFLDDDDLWEAEYLEKVAALLSERETDYLITRLDRLVDGTITPYRSVQDVSTLLEKVWVTNPGVGGPNSIIRRESFLDVGGYDPQLVTSEDRSLIAEFLLRGLAVIAAPGIQAIARMHDGDRLTDPARMAEGKRRFLAKYAKEMAIGARLRNLAAIELQRLKASRNPWHLLLLTLYFPASEIMRWLEVRRGR